MMPLGAKLKHAISAFVISQCDDTGAIANRAHRSVQRAIAAAGLKKSAYGETDIIDGRIVYSVGAKAQRQFAAFDDGIDGDNVRAAAETQHLDNEEANCPQAKDNDIIAQPRPRVAHGSEGIERRVQAEGIQRAQRWQQRLYLILLLCHQFAGRSITIDFLAHLKFAYR